MILVGEAASERTTNSGIVITGSVESGAKPAVVLAVGPDVTAVTKGQKVAVKWSEGLPVTVNGQAAAVLSDEFVYGIYE